MIGTVAQRYYMCAIKRFFGIHKRAKSDPSSTFPVKSADLVTSARENHLAKQCLSRLNKQIGFVFISKHISCLKGLLTTAGQAFLPFWAMNHLAIWHVAIAHSSTASILCTTSLTVMYFSGAIRDLRTAAQPLHPTPSNFRSRDTGCLLRLHFDIYRRVTQCWVVFFCFALLASQPWDKPGVRGWEWHLSLIFLQHLRAPVAFCHCSAGKEEETSWLTLSHCLLPLHSQQPVHVDSLMHCTFKPCQGFTPTCVSLCNCLKKKAKPGVNFIIFNSIVAYWWWHAVQKQLPDISLQLGPSKPLLKEIN